MATSPDFDRIAKSIRDPDLKRRSGALAQRVIGLLPQPLSESPDDLAAQLAAAREKDPLFRARIDSLGKALSREEEKDCSYLWLGEIKKNGNRYVKYFIGQSYWPDRERQLGDVGDDNNHLWQDALAYAYKKPEGINSGVLHVGKVYKPWSDYYGITGDNIGFCYSFPVDKWSVYHNDARLTHYEYWFGFTLPLTRGIDFLNQLSDRPNMIEHLAQQTISEVSGKFNLPKWSLDTVTKQRHEIGRITVIPEKWTLRGDPQIVAMLPLVDGTRELKIDSVKHPDVVVI